jgi:hypothetical protein
MESSSSICCRWASGARLVLEVALLLEALDSISDRVLADLEECSDVLLRHLLLGLQPDHRGAQIAGLDAADVHACERFLNGVV